MKDVINTYGEAVIGMCAVALSGTKVEGWYVEEAKQAMQEGRIAYAGKYSAPDYERILAAGCTLAIENTMVLHLSLIHISDDVHIDYLTYHK